MLLGAPSSVVGVGAAKGDGGRVVMLAEEELAGVVGQGDALRGDLKKEKTQTLAMFSISFHVR